MQSQMTMLNSTPELKRSDSVLPARDREVENVFRALS